MSEPEIRYTFKRGSIMAIRQALLAIVDAIEQELGIKPRTAEIRKTFKTGGDGLQQKNGD